MRLPLPAFELNKWVPHRPPMAWITNVVEVDDAGGVCTVEMNTSAPYCEEGGRMRPSAAIEFIAQSYAYVSAHRVVSEGNAIEDANRRVLLAGFSDVQISDRFLTAPKDISNILIRVSLKREVGPLALIYGELLDSEERVIASAQLKVFNG